MSMSSRCSSNFTGQTLWRPITLEPLVLVPIALVSIVFIIIIELLSRLDHRDGGVLLFSEPLTSHVVLAYQLIPTTIAIVLGLVWSWVDLDARRLEPFFQLSKPKGGNLKNTLDLHYPFDFVAWASFKAVKNRYVLVQPHASITNIDADTGRSSLQV